MKTLGKYGIKGYTPILYTWSPDKTKIKNTNKIVTSPPPSYCTAVAGSQGEDYKTTYVYNIILNSKNIFERLAYVECDYVE